MKQVKGIITFFLILLNSIWVIVAVIPIGLLRLIPFKPFQIMVLKINERLAEIWLHLNKVIQDVMHGQYDNAVRGSIARSTPSRHKSASLNGMVSLKDRMKGFSAAGAETTKEKPTISSTPRMTKQSCKEECHGNKKVENEPSESSEYDSTSTASDEDDSETTLDLEDEENDGDFDLLEESASEVSLTEGTNLIQEVKEDDNKIKEILPGSTIANDVERQDRPKIRTAVKREKSGELGVMNFDFNDAVRNSIARSTPQRHKSSSLQGATSLKDRMKAFAK